MLFWHIKKLFLFILSFKYTILQYIIHHILYNFITLFKHYFFNIFNSFLSLIEERESNTIILFFIFMYKFCFVFLFCRITWLVDLCIIQNLFLRVFFLFLYEKEYKKIIRKMLFFVCMWKKPIKDWINVIRTRN